MAEGWQGIRLSVRSQARFLEPIRTVFREATELAGLPEEDSAEVVLAVTEACANIIKHCYESAPDKRIDLTISFREEDLEIRIDDYGCFVDPSCMKGRELDDIRPGGLGVHLMRKVMDEVRYEENAWGGTTLTMVKSLAPRDEQPDEDETGTTA